MSILESGMAATQVEKSWSLADSVSCLVSYHPGSGVFMPDFSGVMLSDNG